jgi:exosome complex component RRP42
MMEEITWHVKSDYVHQLARQKQRQDGRAMDEYRKIEVVPDYVPNSPGSALVRIGATQVLAGVSLNVGAPFPDQPETGVFMTGAELVPLASPTFEAGPPSQASIEVARVVDRGIRESKAIDFEKLCITPKEKVWMVMLDLHVLDYDGNLFDAGELASIIALHRARLPKYEDDKVVRGEYQGKLPISKKPVSCTFAKIADQLMLDPILDEEKSADARLTLATFEDGFCAAQKGGTGSFTQEELDAMLDLALSKGKDLRKLVK